MLKEDFSFLQVVSVVTSGLGCSIDSIDINGRRVSITCPGGKRQERQCAEAIGDILQENPQSKGMWPVCEY